MAKYVEKELPNNDLEKVGTYGLKLLEAKHSNPDANLRVNLKFEITAPEERKGRKYFETFFLGTDEDPQAENPDTRKGFVWGIYRGLLVAAKIPRSGDTEEDCAALTAAQPEVVGDVGINKAGDRNRISRFYEPGKKQPGFKEAAGSKSVSSSGEAKASSVEYVVVNGKRIPKSLAALAQAQASAEPAPEVREEA